MAIKVKLNTMIRRNKKGALELSVNMLVTVIISLVVLAGGITLLYKLLGGAGELQGTLDKQTQEELERLLVDQGKQVVLPYHSATIERGKNHVFGLGVLNIGESKEFNVIVSLFKVSDGDNHDIISTLERAAVDNWPLYDHNPKTIAESQHDSWEILIAVPNEALPGQYIFDARAMTGEQQYGNAQKIIVQVT